jgi:hypothetical protein
MPSPIAVNPQGVNESGSTPLEVHKFYSTEGWGGWTAAGTNGLTLACPASPPDVCHFDPYWDIANQSNYPGQANALHGHEYEVDRYDTDGTTLLKQDLTQYNAVCTPPWINALSPNVSGYTNNYWNSNLVAPLDLGNPIVACDIQTSQVVRLPSNWPRSCVVPWPSESPVGGF